MTITNVRRTPNHLWGPDWEQVRRHWRVSDSVFHFNHGAYGAVPVPVREAQAELHARIDANPTGFYRRELDDLLEAARLDAAAYCGASADGFGFVRNASEGMTVTIEALPLEPGDELLITNHIYPAVRLAVENKARASGAKIVEVAMPFTDDDTEYVSVITAAMSKKTRAFVVDEIASPTGRVFPIRELSKETKERGIVFVVDGAHSPGQFKLSVDTLGADMWVGNFHKWVCTAHSAGAVWVAPQWRKAIEPASVGYRDRMPYPQRFGRLGTDDLTGALCVPAAIKFLKSIGAERIYKYNTELAAYGAKAITMALGTAPVPGRFAARHPANLPAGIATTPDAALTLQTRIATELKAEVSVAAPIGTEKNGAVLVSAFLYNHPSEYDEFAQLLKQLLASYKR